MKRTIFLKTFVSYFLISSVVAGLIFFFTLHLVRRFYEADLETHLHTLAATVKPLAGRSLQENDLASLQSYVRQVRRDVRLTVIDMHGRVVADSDAEPVRMENHADRPEVRSAMDGRAEKDQHFSNTLRQHMLYYAVPIPGSAGPIGVLRLSVPVAGGEEWLGRFRHRLWIFLAVILLLSLLVSVFFSHHWSKPVRLLVQSSRQVAAGELSRHVYLENRDEFGELASSFNTMIDHQKELIDTLQTRQRELEAIIRAVSEGLVVIGGDGRITLAGEGFKRIIGRGEVQGKLYWEVWRDARVDQMLQAVADTAADHHGEIEINGRNYLIAVAPVAGNGRVVTLYDLSELRRLEKIKKDFVINVSHELRTPLTAIKGFVETMAEEETLRNPQYLETIRRHTDRMIDMVNDLLTLGELEEKNALRSGEMVDLKPLLENVRAIFARRAAEKGIGIELQAAPGEWNVRGEPFQLEQLFINLLDNAVKYTEKGGVTVSLARGPQGEVSVEVRDSGCGIAAEHLPRIFERFYVVDKARSRKVGGTGLGLAIVKHIMLGHGGAIAVESRPDQGTCFILRFPPPRPVEKN